MVTRLQSVKGSFVQSPKGVFDGEEAVGPPSVGIVSTITDDISISVDAGCQIAALPSTGVRAFTITFDPGVTFAQASTSIWHGLTSGDDWDANQVVFHCAPQLGTIQTITIYNGDQSSGSGFVRYNNLLQLVEVDAIPGTVFQGIVTIDPVTFPGTPVPSWTVGESISLLSP